MYRLSKPEVLKLESGSESLGGFLETQIAGPCILSFSRSGMSPGICISYRFLGDADAAGPGITFEEPLLVIISHLVGSMCR